jgi:hypothetical protein
MKKLATPKDRKPLKLTKSTLKNLTSLKVRTGVRAGSRPWDCGSGSKRVY